MNQEKLKPCPFCGGEAEIRTFTATRANITHYFPTCKVCNCWETCLSKEEAVGVWDRRCADNDWGDGYGK